MMQAAFKWQWTTKRWNALERNAIWRPLLATRHIGSRRIPAHAVAMEP